jgi:hypothetical protein
MSNQIITPDVWGPHGWKFIHYITMAYPENPTLTQKEKYKVFLLLLKDVLPCSLCAKHYEENLKVLPLSDEILDDKEKLIKWLIDVHNRVNVSTGKPEMEYTEARKSIEKPYLYYKKKNNNNNNNNTHYLLIILILVAVIFYLYYKKKYNKNL